LVEQKCIEFEEEEEKKADVYPLWDKEVPEIR
jgi:hypothetical protein